MALHFELESGEINIPDDVLTGSRKVRMVSRTYHLEEDVADELEKAAAAMDMKKSEFVRKAIGILLEYYRENVRDKGGSGGRGRKRG